MRFDFFPLRFDFAAREPLYFAPGKAANTLRGALGTIFRNLACQPDCEEPRTCSLRASCPYARIFAPESDGHGPSGLSDPPRPFVFRASHLDGRFLQPGTPFYFDLNVFTPNRDTLAFFILSFRALASEGLGPGRGRADLLRVRRLPFGELPELALFENLELSDAQQFEAGPIQPATLCLEPLSAAPERIRVEFVTPTELKHDHTIAARPEFPILFGRIRDRLSTLRRLYGPGPLEVDYQGSSLRAASIRMVNCNVFRQEAERRSSRTGQRHSIGGFVGSAEYEGDLAEFLPYLEAARWTGAGRQAVWGKGELRIFL